MVRPIGLREPKYSPFGPDRVDRVWTGVCAPVVNPKVGSVDEGKVELNLEEKRQRTREKIQGDPLSNAERIALVERFQRHRTKRQINIGNMCVVIVFYLLSFICMHVRVCVVFFCVCVCDLNFGGMFIGISVLSFDF